MKRLFYKYLHLFLCVSFSFLLMACEGPKKEYYGMDDFQSIVPGESTYRDVCNIVSPMDMIVTSFGGVCKFPTQDGGSICVFCYGPELVVERIEVRTPGNGFAEDKKTVLNEG